jgi:hypothetical protein
MIQVFNDPLLLDFIRVAISLPEDERAQIEAFVGQKYDIDSVAIGNYQVPGPKYVIKDVDKDVILAVGGFKQQRPGVWRDYMLTGPAAWEKEYWFQTTRICRRALDIMFQSKQAHRLECITPLARLKARPEIERWYRYLGYQREGIRHGYCANGADAVAFARVSHGHR